MNMDEDKIQKMQKSQAASEQGISAKQQKTRQSVKKTGEDTATADLDNNIKTYITHNKGGKWELIKAPSEGVDG